MIRGEVLLSDADRGADTHVAQLAGGAKAVDRRGANAEASRDVLHCE